MENNTEEGSVDLQTTIVVNDPNFLNLFMKRLTRARSADHVRQHLLGDLWNHPFGLILLAVASEQKKSTSKPFPG